MAMQFGGAAAAIVDQNKSHIGKAKATQLQSNWTHACMLYALSYQQVQVLHLKYPLRLRLHLHLRRRRRSEFEPSWWCCQLARSRCRPRLQLP